jgi:toxin ParE1/3/4
MAEVIWTEPALGDLDAIADYIALDNPRAAALLVQRICKHVDQLVEHPRSGSKVPELKGWRYRQIVEPPCRVLYRQERSRVYILHVVRSERLLRVGVLVTRRKTTKK